MISAIGAGQKVVARADIRPCFTSHRPSSPGTNQLASVSSLSSFSQAHRLRVLHAATRIIGAEPSRAPFTLRAVAGLGAQSERLQLNGSVWSDTAWSPVTEDLAIGSSVTTNSPEAVKALRDGFGITAIVNVEEESALSARGSSWEAERQRLEGDGLVAVRVPVREGDSSDQAAMLPQVVRVVGALVASGHKVLLQCSSGNRISPLMAIGYLMFVRGMPTDAASALVSERRAGISPPMGVLTEAMEKVLAGATARVIEIAERTYRQRVANGQTGDSNSDWQQAQRAYVNEAFAKWLAADVSFADSISQAAERKSKSEVEKRATTSAATAAVTNKNKCQPIRWSETGTSDALKAANARIESLSRELDGVTRLADMQTETLQKAGSQVAALTTQLESLQRKEALYTEALFEATERMNLLAEKVTRLEREGREEKQSLQQQVAELKARLTTGEQRGTRASTIIQGLRMELQAAKDEVKDQWVAVSRAEKSIQTLSGKLKLEEDRANKAEAATRAAQEDKKRALGELEGARSEKIVLSKDSMGQIGMLTQQVADLSGRLKKAMATAEQATSRANVLQTQVEQLAAKGKAAEEREAAAGKAAAVLTSQVKTLEVTSADATSKATRLAQQLDALRVKEASTAAESAASDEKLKQLMGLVGSLTEREAKQRQRANETEAKLKALYAQDADLAMRAEDFSRKMEEMARQMARLNAELAFAEGRESEFESAWRSSLGAASEVLGDLGPETAALAAERGVEMEMEAVEGRPGEMLRVLMERVTTETAAVTARSGRLIAESHQLRMELSQTTSAADYHDSRSPAASQQSMKEYLEAAEEMAVQQKQKLIDRVGRLQWALGGTLAMAVVVPAAIFNTFYTDVSHDRQVDTLRERLDQATSSSQQLETAVAKAETGRRAAASAVSTLEEVVFEQRGAVERLQSLIPLVAPSVQSDEAARFCDNVPVEFQSAVTQRFCGDLRGPQESKTEAPAAAAAASAAKEKSRAAVVEAKAPAPVAKPAALAAPAAASVSAAIPTAAAPALSSAPSPSPISATPSSPTNKDTDSIKSSESSKLSSATADVAVDVAESVPAAATDAGVLAAGVAVVGAAAAGVVAAVTGVADSAIADLADAASSAINAAAGGPDPAATADGISAADTAAASAAEVGNNTVATGGEVDGDGKEKIQTEEEKEKAEKGEGKGESSSTEGPLEADSLSKDE